MTSRPSKYNLKSLSKGRVPSKMQHQPVPVDERVVQLLERHRAAVATPDGCQKVLDKLMKRKNAEERSGFLWLRKAAWLGCRLVLLYAFCTISLNCAENSFPSLSNEVRTGRALSYLNLIYLKSYRWLTVQLGFYRSEFMHKRDRESCLVPNPLYQRPVMCCDCKPLSIARVRLNNPSGRDVFRRILDRHASPFLVTDSSHRPVTFAELRRTVLDTWKDVSAGSNRVTSVPGGGPTSLEELMTQEQPPAARLTTWTYGHMSAIRAVRQLVPRPPFIRPDVEYGFARTFHLFSHHQPADEAAAPDFLGDLSYLDGLVVVLGLQGSVQITLSAKQECCPDIRAKASVVVEPGQALVLPSNCYRVHAARQGTGQALLHLFSLFSSTGIRQAAPITGRVPVTDDTEDEY